MDFSQFIKSKPKCSELSMANRGQKTQQTQMQQIKKESLCFLWMGLFLV